MNSTGGRDPEGGNGSARIPENWLSSPPESLVLGSGPYASALAFVLEAGLLDCETLEAGPAENDGYPQVLEKLERILLVVGNGMPAADALRHHRAAWEWVGKLSPAGDQHELAFLFVLPPDASQALEESLAVGLGIPEFDPKSTGHAVWRMSGSLESLLSGLAGTRPLDLPPLRARQAADVARVALRKLQQAADSHSMREAARAVLSVFSGREYHLDLFCRPPSHRHGNLLRGWLHTVVTSEVTPGSLEEGNHPSQWLADLEGTI